MLCMAMVKWSMAMEISWKRVRQTQQVINNWILSQYKWAYPAEAAQYSSKLKSKLQIKSNLKCVKPHGAQFVALAERRTLNGLGGTSRQRVIGPVWRSWENRGSRTRNGCSKCEIAVCTYPLQAINAGKIFKSTKIAGRCPGRKTAAWGSSMGLVCSSKGTSTLSLNHSCKEEQNFSRNATGAWDEMSWARVVL